MNGYVEAGYVVVLGTLSSYAATLAVRERAARMRLGPAAKSASAPPAGETGAGGEGAGLDPSPPAGGNGAKDAEGSL